MGIEARRCVGCGASLPKDGLVCAHCATTHVVTGGGLGVACPTCGAGNRPDAGACAACSKDLVVTCPECRARSPIGGRFCQECRLELATYKRARTARVACRIGLEDAEQRALTYLAGALLGPGDVRERARVIERTLVWVPVWRFRARVTGRVEGRVAHTHYRTTSRPTHDAKGEVVQEVDSEPYQVWEHVQKTIDTAVDLGAPASRDGRPLLDGLVEAGAWDAGDGLAALFRPVTALFGGGPAAGAAADEPVEREGVASEPWARAFDPDEDDASVFDRLRRAGLERARREALDEVQHFDVRVLGPALHLTYHPVWRLLWRYGRRHGEVRLHGATGQTEGARPGLLDRWLA